MKLIFCKLYTLKLLSGKYEDGGGVGGHGLYFCPRIPQEYTFRHRSAHRIPVEGG